MTTIIDQMSRVITALSGGNYGMYITSQSLQESEPEIEQLKGRLHLSTSQLCLFLAAWVLTKRNGCFTVIDLKVYMHINNNILLSYSSDMDEIERRGLILRDYSVGLIWVPELTLDLINTNLYSPPSNPDLWRDLRRQTTIFDRKLLGSISGWSKKITKYINTWEQAAILLRAGLIESEVNGRPALIRQDIDFSDYSIRRNRWLVNRLKSWETDSAFSNLDLIGEGAAPRDPNGDPYHLHHLAQTIDGPLAELTAYEHIENGENFAILHPLRGMSIDRQESARQKAAHWRSRFRAIKQQEHVLIRSKDNEEGSTS